VSIIWEMPEGAPDDPENSGVRRRGDPGALALADGPLVPDFARHEGEELTSEGHHVALAKAAGPELAVDVLREDRDGLGITFDCFAQCFCHD